MMMGMWKGMRRFDKEGIGGGRIAQRMLAGMPGMMVGMRKGWADMKGNGWGDGGSHRAMSAGTRKEMSRCDREWIGGWGITQGMPAGMPGMMVELWRGGAWGGERIAWGMGDHVRGYL